MSPTETNKRLVAQIFQELASGDKGALLRRTAADSEWTVTGHCPVSGTYASRQEFYEKALRRITSRLAGAVAPTVVSLLAEGDRVVVEWRGKATTKSGGPYDNSYCWILRLAHGEIQQGIIYCDTQLVSEVLA